MAIKYPIGQNARQTTTILGISAKRVLRRAGLSEDLADQEDVNVDAATYFRIWEAMIAEAGHPDTPTKLAMAYAHGPFLPPIFAFSCAETLVLGLQRLADFKPLLGPLVSVLSRPGGQLRVDLLPAEPGLVIPPSLGVFELLYIIECARCFTGTRVVPLATSLPGPVELDPDALAYLGAAPQVTGTLGLTFAAEDADRPLITRSAALWETLEPGFLEQLDQQTGTASLTDRIRAELTKALPGGATTIDDMARRLNLSKRSLQRRLSEEGTTFQDLLTRTRRDMSERYLAESRLSVPEISFLLGFRETSSFFRAFHGWTGMTPGDFRAAGGTRDTRPSVDGAA